MQTLWQALRYSARRRFKSVCCVLIALLALALWRVPSDSSAQETSASNLGGTFQKKGEKLLFQPCRLPRMAAGGMRQGRMTLSQEQLNAACDEAKKQGLRTLVHANRDAVPAVTLAGCTQIEHGLGATDDDLKLMAEKRTYLDPQAGPVIDNYLLNKEKFLGTPGFPTTLEGFAPMKEIPPMIHEVLRRAVKTPGLA